MIYLAVVSVVQSLNHIQLFATPWTVVCQASLSITISWSMLKLMSIESVMLSSHLILCLPLLLPSVFPASGSFPVSRLFTSSGQSVGAIVSASILPVNSHRWFSSGWTGLISLLSKDSQESSPAPQFESINSSALSFLYGPALTSVHDYWNISLTIWTLISQVMSRLFNTLSRFVIAFLPRSKRLLISYFSFFNSSFLLSFILFSLNSDCYLE